MNDQALITKPRSGIQKTTRPLGIGHSSGLGHWGFLGAWILGLGHCLRVIVSSNVLVLAILPGGALLSTNVSGCRIGQRPVDPGIGTARVRGGALSVEFRDNAESPQLLSGVDRLFHVDHAPAFDAFDPNDPGSSAGLNFEHIISGHNDPANWFAPRHG
ncbi:MAG: hypothetical protein MUF48_15190, partial [Pirellulaceae bacterium]|nr:hypothetical protein [Pirellulaceae bacterium]